MCNKLHMIYEMILMQLFLNTIIIKKKKLFIDTTRYVIKKFLSTLLLSPSSSLFFIITMLNSAHTTNFREKTCKVTTTEPDQ